MSRIGRLPIEIPAGVTVKIGDANEVVVKGAKGELTRKFNNDMKIEVEGNQVVVTRPSDDKEHRALHGLTRALLANMVNGVNAEFAKELDVVGVGYRAQLSGKKLVLNVGYSHPVEMDAPAGISFEVPNPNKIIVKGIDKQLVETVCKYAKPENIVIQLDNALIPRRSNSFREIGKAIGRVATTNANCIIFGESGMGKEQIARQIYLQSSRTQKPLKVLEAGSAPLVGKHDPESDRSEIYNRIEGYFQEVKGGTLIIKNIQLLTFETQSVLLHILEQEHPDVRIISTANGNLLKMVADGSFRDNLFYMLRQRSISVPSLRESTEDIADIADYLLQRYAQKKQRPKQHLDASAIKALKLHPWPGNVRELKDAVLFAAFHAKEDTITAEDIRLDDATPDNAEDLTHRNPRTEKENIIKAFNRAGTWRGAAKLLGVSEKTLIQLRKKHHINPDGEIEA